MSWTCLKCSRELIKENQWHNCVTVSVDSLFKGSAGDLVLAFDNVLAEVADWNDVIVSTTQNCIVFVHRYTFLIIRPMKHALDLKFYSEQMLEDSLVVKSVIYSSKYENHIRLLNAGQVTSGVFDLILKSYKML